MPRSAEQRTHTADIKSHALNTLSQVSMVATGMVWGGAAGKQCIVMCIHRHSEFLQNLTYSTLCV